MLKTNEEAESKKLERKNEHEINLLKKKIQGLEAYSLKLSDQNKYLLRAIRRLQAEFINLGQEVARKKK